MRVGTGAAMLSISMVLLAGCTSTGTTTEGGSDEVWAPERATLPAAVEGFGTIVDTGDAPVLCLGRIAESLPPQCSGLTLEAWDWAVVGGGRHAADVTWGTYTIEGRWDGETLTVTRASPATEPVVDRATVDPFDDSLPPGALSSAPSRQPVSPELRRALPDLVSLTFINGRVVIDVPFDDGRLQASVDERYGVDSVVVASALRPAVP